MRPSNCALSRCQIAFNAFKSAQKDIEFSESITNSSPLIKKTVYITSTIIKTSLSIVKRAKVIDTAITDVRIDLITFLVLAHVVINNVIKYRFSLRKKSLGLRAFLRKWTIALLSHKY